MKPVERFNSLLEIREYLGGDRVQCLICGKMYLRLTYTHLLMHNLSADEYREQFGIPWTYSLTSAPSRANTSRVQTAVNKANLTYRRQPGETTEHNRKAPVAAQNYWKDTIRPQGPLKSAQARVIVPCDDCGIEVPTTELTKVHGTRCKNCRVIAKQARDAARATQLPRCA